jgi:hypothetical protein
MKTLLITDRYSDSSRQSLMKIRKHIMPDKSAKLEVIEIMPWIRIKLHYDDAVHDKQRLITALRAHQFVAAEV